MLQLPAGADLAFLAQAEMDDVRHDASFPEHALSRVRASLRWLQADLRVREPAPPRARGEVALPRLGCALEPPPRFIHARGFCATDGLERLLVARERGRCADLVAHATAAARRIHEDAGVAGVAVAVQELPPRATTRRSS
jgi:hypothetical protein